MPRTSRGPSLPSGRARKCPASPHAIIESYMPSITCIYCKQERPPSDEHVLQKSLGGNLITTDVCRECNVGFSNIDQALADRSIVSFTRLADTSPLAFGVKLGSRVTCTDPDGNPLEPELTNGYQGTILPQVILKPDRTVAYTASDERSLPRFVAYIDKLIATDSLDGMRTVEDPETDSAAVVMHRDKEGYLRVPAVGAKGQFLELLRYAWGDLRQRMTAPDPARTIGKPELHVHLVYDPNSVYRAIAKTAFNALANSRGTVLVLREEFDPVRDYIAATSTFPRTSLLTR